MARLLFLGASVSQLPAIEYARDAGHHVIACDGDPNAVAFPLCDVAATIDFSDVDRVAELGAQERVEGVLAVCTDRAVGPAAAVAERLGLPGIGPSVARAMSHKPTMRDCLEAAGVPQPAYALVRAGERLPSGVSLPAVLKPADSGGQRGVFRIDHAQQFDHHLPEALGFSHAGEALFEEYVDGQEINSLFAVRDGVPHLLIASDRNRPRGAGFGVGWIHSFPSRLAPEQVARVEEVAADAIRALGLRDGIAFPQLLVDGDRVLIVEVAARIAAGQMASLLRHATGINVFAVAVQQALGRPVPDELVTPTFVRPAAVRFLTAAPGTLPVGTVTDIDGLDDVRAVPGVVEAGLYFGVGARIRPLQVDADRMGYVIATGSSAPDALERATDGASRLRLTTEPAQSTAGQARPLVALALAVILAAIAGTLALLAYPRLRGAVVTAVRVDRALAPACACRYDVARISFRLLDETRVGVRIANASGRIVATILRARSLPAGPVTLRWNGEARDAVRAPDGTYFPELVFPSQDRTLRISTPIRVVATAPRGA